MKVCVYLCHDISQYFFYLVLWHVGGPGFSGAVSHKQGYMRHWVLITMLGNNADLADLSIIVCGVGERKDIIDLKVIQASGSNILPK